MRYIIKRSILISAAVMVGLSLLCVAVSLAENKAGESIFDYKKELSLTDMQEKNMRGILTKLQNYRAGKQAALDALRAELNKMIAEKAELSKIKAKLESIAKVQVEATYEDIVSARAIERELTSIQLSKWHSIQENFRKNQQDMQSAASKAKEIKK
jgi:hypothetical protein